MKKLLGFLVSVAMIASSAAMVYYVWKVHPFKLPFCSCGRPEEEA